jgi:hypothetical protein
LAFLGGAGGFRGGAGDAYHGHRLILLPPSRER